MQVRLLVLLVALCSCCCGASQPYLVDNSGEWGRMFDGIGGLSGGGATSRLLVDYPAKQRNDILNFLFQPHLAAALQILKVEIGGDAQSTDGTESSHMHTEDDENYQRGYEWWLMKEAKSRNSDIKLYGLAWAYPSWVGNGTGSPYKFPNVTAGYIVNWIKGAKREHDLDIDYVGIWNERNYDSTYIKTLRKALDAASLTNVQIVAADGNFGSIATDVVNDPELKAAVSILGAHYPGTKSTDNAMKSEKPLWASEDYSTYNDDVGAGCWARILNQNYVNGHMTSTISWNLIASYYDGLPYYRDGLMTAVEPWSGHYVVNGPVWITGHTTLFTTIGMYYLAHGKGVGMLDNGGSYVTLYNTETKDFAIIIETMSHDNSICIRPPLPKYDVKPQTATFQLSGTLTNTTSLNVWYSMVSAGKYMQKGTQVKVNSNGQFQVALAVDMVMTLTTNYGPYIPPPPDVPAANVFPTPYTDDFDDYPLESQARYFAAQTGVFEIAQSSSGNQVLRQVVTSRPITWCNDAASPITIIGNHSWVSMNFSVKAKLEMADSSVFIAGGVSKGGCSVASATGIFAFVSGSGKWMVTSDLAMKTVLKSGTISIKPDTWYKLSMNIDANTNMTVSLVLDTVTATIPLPKGYSGGFVGLGTGGFYNAQFDNFQLNSAMTAPAY